MSRRRPAAVALFLLLVGAVAARATSAQPSIGALGLTPDGLTRALTSGPRLEVAPDPPRTFGIATETAHVVPAGDFDTEDSIDGWDYVSAVDPTLGVIVRRSGGPVTWFSGVRLPAGAVVTRLEVAGCDASPAQELLFALFRANVPPGTGFEAVTAAGTTGLAAVPVCGRFSVTPSSPPLVVDNANATYWVGIRGNSSALFESVRVFYHLQVSPAPAAATFGDVPTSHPFFQFIEALAASGITAGCGGGNYCPDAALTRGQMAVFLAKGLGLHFAP